MPEALLIFLVPPSLETLSGRLQSRATETDDELELRQRNAALELARQDHYDYVVVNETGQLTRTAERIGEIIDPSGPSTRTVGSGSEGEPRRPSGSSRSPSTRPGRGARTYTYAVPRSLAGSSRARRSSWSTAGARRSGSSWRATRAARRPAGPSRSSTGSGPTDRSCLRSACELARWIAGHYLAPPAVVLRAMLPPGLLERLELVAEARPAGATAATRRPRGRSRGPACGGRCRPCLISSPPARGRSRPGRPGGPGRPDRRLRDLAGRGWSTSTGPRRHGRRAAHERWR